MRARYPDWIIKKQLSFELVCRDAEYSLEYLAVSHRWELPGDPDPDGTQLAALRRFLLAAPRIKWVFYDLMTLPQGTDKTAVEKAEFGLMLPNINMLYLGAKVLILMDREYLNRFWTQFEAWLAFQVGSCWGSVAGAGPGGLRLNPVDVF